MGLREGKVAETRRAIRAAALELFDELGYDGATVEDIAARAGVSPRTVYRHFPTKDALILDRSHEVLAEFLSAGAATGDLSARRALEVVADRIAEYPGLDVQARLILANPGLASTAGGHIREWEETIAAAVARERGGTEAGLEEHVFAGAVIVVLRAAIREWARGDGDVPLQEVLARALAALERVTRS